MKVVSDRTKTFLPSATKTFNAVFTTKDESPWFAEPSKKEQTISIASYQKTLKISLLWAIHQNFAAVTRAFTYLAIQKFQEPTLALIHKRRVNRASLQTLDIKKRSGSSWRTKNFDKLISLAKSSAFFWISIDRSIRKWPYWSAYRNSPEQSTYSRMHALIHTFTRSYSQHG